MDEKPTLVTHAEGLRVEYIVLHAPSHPGGYKPTPNTRHAGERFVEEYGGELKCRVVSDWVPVRG